MIWRIMSHVLVTTVLTVYLVLVALAPQQSDEPPIHNLYVLP